MQIKYIYNYLIFKKYNWLQYSFFKFINNIIIDFFKKKKKLNSFIISVNDNIYIIFIYIYCHLY